MWEKDNRSKLVIAAGAFLMLITYLIEGDAAGNAAGVMVAYDLLRGFAVGLQMAGLFVPKLKQAMRKGDR